MGAAVLAAAGLAGTALLARVGGRPALAPSAEPRGAEPGRLLHASAALLSVSVLADSAVEHYRGSFKNPGMYTPLLVSALSLLAGIDGGERRPDAAPGAGRPVYGLAAAVGVVGLGFHLYNVLRRPGGLRWQNAVLCRAAGRAGRPVPGRDHRASPPTMSAPAAPPGG